MEIRSKYVLITGGNSGIGRFLAGKFAASGYTVFITVRRQSLMNAAVNTPNIHPLCVDVRNETGIKQAYRTLQRDFGVGHLNILVNNAGIVVPGAIHSIHIEDIHDQFNVNVTGALRITKQFLPLLAAGNGSIIAIGSMSGRMAVPFAGAYGASKAALKQIFWALRLELKPVGVSVFHLELGNFKTPIWEKSFKKAMEIRDPVYDPYMQTALKVMKERSVKTNDPGNIWKIVHKIARGKHRKFNTLIGKDAKRRKLITRFAPAVLLEKFLVRKFRLI